MLTSKGILALFFVTLVVMAAAFVSRQSGNDIDISTQGPYFPHLLQRSNDVVKAVAKSGGSVVTISKSGGEWRIVEADGYPAAADRVRELILGLARLERVEMKTKNPDLYGKLELDDVTELGSASSLLQLMDESGKSLAALIVGKRKPGQSRDRIYVRSPGDAQAWLVEGFLPATGGGAVAWMDQAIIVPPVGEVRAMAVKRESGSVTVSRAAADAKDFVLEGIGADEEIESQYAVNQVARSLEDLRFDNVVTESDSGPEEGAYAEVMLETFDRERIELKLNKQGDRYVGRLRAEYAGTGEAGDKVKQWNDLWRDRVYILPSYQVDSIVVKKEDLIKAGE